MITSNRGKNPQTSYVFMCFPKGIFKILVLGETVQRGSPFSRQVELKAEKLSVG